MRMLSCWKEKTLEEVCSKIGSGATPRGGQDSYKESGISLIRSQNVLDYGFSYNGLAFIDQSQADGLANVEVQKEDVLINITGDSVARVCMVPDNVLPARVNQHVAILRSKPEALYAYFLKYYLLNPATKQALLNTAYSGGTRNALTKGGLQSWPIFLPSVSEQKAIAAVLSSFDDKIELLRRQNKTLEKIAQTIFKEWFVNFTVNGKKLKINDTTGLPERWRFVNLENLIDVRDGTHDSPKPTKHGYHLITSRHLNQMGLDFKNAYFISISDYEAINRRSRVDRYDILISMIGTVGLLYFVLDQEINYAIKNIGLFKTSQRPEMAEYIYLFLSSSEGKQCVRVNMAGTTQSYITLGLLRGIPLIIPTESILQEFKVTISPIFQKYHINNCQIQTLSKLRDLLLPKLMKGEIRVKDAEKPAEEVA